MTTLLAVTGYAASKPRPTPVPRDAVIVTLPRATARVGGRLIPAGFLGLSLENTAIIPYAGRDPHRLDPVFVQLIRNLTARQSPMLRIGGDSTDEAWYPVRGMTKPKTAC